MKMKGHRGNCGHQGHRGNSGHHGPHHGPHRASHDEHDGPRHENHFELNPHKCKPKHGILKRLHTRLHKRDRQHHARKLHFCHTVSPKTHQVNRNPGMMKHFMHHCKSVFCHFRIRSCENETAHSRPTNHHHGHKHGCRRAGGIGMPRAIMVANKGLEHPQNRRCSSLPPTVSVNNTDCQQL